ncbi:hypothetical protein [Paenibacillus sp. YIM B09110]|uniref:hypothetical protein n=1 Tax=Paenibacillus sp. YIM B09110 TaxID=3126102 RepID=UPI00301BB5D6
MNVAVTLYPTYDSNNSYNRDQLRLEGDGDEVRVYVGDRELRVKRTEFQAAARVIEMTGSDAN